MDRATPAFENTSQTALLEPVSVPKIRVSKRRFGFSRVLAGLIPAAAFIYFHWFVTRAHFSGDDMMNMYMVWRPPLWKTLLSFVTFWDHTVRPLAAIYYLPIRAVAGLNPHPFNAVRIAFLFIGLILFYFMAKRVTRSWWIASLAAVPIAYHAEFGWLAYGGGFIYDILCGGFYFAALLYYIRARSNHSALGVRRASIFFALFILSLDSKEMAVSIPVMMLAYELLYQGRRAKFIPVAIAVVMTMLYIKGKTAVLTPMEAYRPVYTWARFSESNVRFMNQLFYTDSFTMGWVLAIWAILLYFGIRNWIRPNPDPRWLFLWIWIMVTPLPLSFLPYRGGAMLYIPLAGWAMLVALILRSAVHRLTRDPVLRLAKPRFVTFASLVLLGGLYFQQTAERDRASVPIYLQNSANIDQTIRAMRRLDLYPRANSRIALLHDPIPDSYGSVFIGYLLWNDPSLYIKVGRELSESDLATMDYVLDFVNGAVVIVRRP